LPPCPSALLTSARPIHRLRTILPHPNIPPSRLPPPLHHLHPLTIFTPLSLLIFIPLLFLLLFCLASFISKKRRHFGRC
jgi:hypothetical protein